MSRLLPRFAKGPWTTLSIDQERAADGFYIVIEWLGFAVEIGFGRLW